MPRRAQPPGHRNGGRAQRWPRAAAPLVVGLVAAGVTLAVVGSSQDRPSDSAADGATPVATRGAGSADTVDAGRALFARMGCGGCHHLTAARSQGAHAPDLDSALDSHTRQSLESKIVDPYPNADPNDFTIMPRDYGRRLSPTELDALVTFLLDAR